MGGRKRKEPSSFLIIVRVFIRSPHTLYLSRYSGRMEGKTGTKRETSALQAASWVRCRSGEVEDRRNSRWKKTIL